MRFKPIHKCLLFAGLCICLTSEELWLRQGLAAQKSRIVFTSRRDGNNENLCNGTPMEETKKD